MRAAKKGMESHLTDCNDIWRSKMQALLFFALFKGQMAQNVGQSWVHENCTYCGLRKLFFSTYLLGASLESMQKQKVVGLKKNKNLLSSTNLATVAHQKQNIAYCKTIPSYLSCCEAAICDLGAAFLRCKANRRRYC